MNATSGGIHAVIGNTATPDEALDPSAPGWHGTVALRRSPRELGWPAAVLSIPPLTAVGTWFVTGDPVDMVLSAVLALAVMVVLDQRRPRRCG